MAAQRLFLAATVEQPAVLQQRRQDVGAVASLTLERLHHLAGHLVAACAQDELPPTGQEESWRRWFEAAGIPETVAPPTSVYFELHSMLVRAVEAGLSIALVSDVFVPAEVCKRGVVKAYDLAIPREDAH